MRVDLIQVPYHMGQESIGPGKGPAAYIEGDAEWVLAQGGHVVRVKAVRRLEPFRDEISAIVDVDSQLAALVRDAVEGGRFPLVLAGNCNSALGTLAGATSQASGVIWFDAWRCNTPAATISGWFEGMPLAVATGQCHSEIWRQIGNREPVRQDATILIGVRDLDPGERDLLDESQVQMVSSQQLKESGIEPAILGPLSELQSRTRQVYLHLDIDVVDPQDAPGVDFPTPGGLRLAHMEQIIAMIGRRFAIKAAALTTFNPERDEDGRTLQTGLRLIRAVVEAAERGRAVLPQVDNIRPE
jgi:arginase